MRKVLIDTDCGLDDASAILLALSQKDVQVVGITTVDGNTSLDNVLVNVLRVLRAAGREDTPVYKGASTSLLNMPRKGSSDYHGKDGLGDYEHHEPVTLEKISPEHAVSAISRLLRENDDLELICLGPLTNLALAIRMDPSLPTRLKRLCIMGGNYKGKGNVSMTGEFNFYRDPEAAHVVLQDVGADCKVMLVGWEVCEENSVSFETAEQLMQQATAKAAFVRNIYSRVLQDRLFPEFVFCDELAMACTLRPDVAKETVSVRFRVELGGLWSRGMAVPDWDKLETNETHPLVTVVTKIDMVKFLQLIKDSLA